MKATIEASAGTGKTYELTTLVAAALCGSGVLAPDERGSGLVDGAEFRSLCQRAPLEASEIALVTYTEAAARELGGRVRARLAAIRRELLRPPAARSADGGSAGSGAAPGLDDAMRRRMIERLSGALADIDSMTIGTIHGFCDGLLREHAFELGRPAARPALADERELARELAMRWWSERVRDDPARSERCRVARIDREVMERLALDAIASRGVPLAVSTGTGVESMALDLMEFARAEVVRLCAARGATTFQDMLLSVRDGLRSSPRFGAELRKRFRFGVIDEAQDTDPVQIEIFERIFHRARSEQAADEPEAKDRLLVLVGDPKQSIYAFRGADLDAYLRWRGREAPRRLEVNRRSEPAAVDAVNRLFSVPVPFGRPGIDHPPVHAESPPRHGTLVAISPGSEPSPGRPAPIEIHRGATGGSAIEWCVAMVRDLMRRGLGIERDGGTRPLRYGDMAVLGRRNGLLANLEQRLRAEGVPTLLLGDRSVLAGTTADELAALLAACAEPGRSALVRRAMVSSLVGVAPAALAGEAGEALVRDWAERFADWARSAPRGGALGVVERAIAASERPLDPRVEVDAVHLAELIHAEGGAHGEARTLLSVLDRLVATGRDRSTTPDDPRRVRMERGDAVTLRTIHGAKGLEYGIVLLPWAGAALGAAASGRGPIRVMRLPAATLASDGGELAPPPHAPPDESVLVPAVKDGPLSAALRARDAEEDRRLFYVAVTRARHATLLFAERPTGATAPSVLDELRAIDRADSRSIRVVEERPPLEESPKPEPRPASIGRARRAARATGRPRVARPLRLWIDTSFTALSHGASDDAIELLARPPVEAVREDEPAPVVTGREISGGAFLGRMVHRIFEWASAEGPGADLGAIVNDAIDEVGAGGRFDTEILRAMAQRTRDADLAGAGGPAAPIGSIEPSSLATELEFCLPMGHSTALSPASLAAALGSAPHGSPAALLATHAAALDFGELRGFLRGVIDLLFEFDGRWWIVDYKSNDLGDGDEDYRAPSLLQEMIRQRYVLQYHLYAVAARRLLRQRGRAMGDEWLGGVVYPFVRGIEMRAPGRGLFVDHPDAAVLDAIDELLRNPAGAPS